MGLATSIALNKGINALKAER